ncbi:probable disease resistance protein RXW24L [Coffea eugenioides]|uniref:probable disease resistance protein RXW24L n=1 Tax=Coffea eugenioides TaxID=49369 RepID=UPI000F608A53|nr:probable disease resistance protein RXW24L [Coffea eugenioides]
MVVHENVKSYLEKGEGIGQGEGELSNILAFSYYDLPYQLKPCFLYLEKFKEDTAIDAETLYELWLAEGMVEIREVQLAVTKFMSCRVHDFTRDLCLLKAKEEKLYKVIEIDQNSVVNLDQSPPEIGGHYRFCLRLHAVESLYPKVCIPLHKDQTKHLRSFVCEPMNGDNKNKFPGRRIMSQVNNLKMLRILAVENSNMASQSFYSRSLMQFIGNLIHLRCLSLRGCTDLTLPYSMGNLKYLETLDLSDSECSTIPDVLWKLRRLRYLYLPYYHSNHKLRLDGLGMSLEILGSFHNRFCLPKDLSKLTNLRALKAIVHENLEDLEQFINHLSNLSPLRVSSLTIKVHDFGINSNRQKGMALLERVLFSKNIHEIEIWGTSCKQLPVYRPSHLLPPPCLSKLELHGSGVEEDPMRMLETLSNCKN